MGGLRNRAWLGGLLLLLVEGCALTAVRPPTPAAALDSAALNYAAPGERFYLLVFASQSRPPRPAYSHSWATVVRVLECPEGAVLQEVHTISWLPASLVIQPLRFTVEPPVNLDLHETLRYALANDERVSLWGPYECRPSFYRRFLVQKEFLESGQIGYQCCDDCGESARTGDGCCCIHAITDMDPEYGRENYPLIWFGDAASEHIVDRFYKVPSLIHPKVEHDWLLEPLGLTQCCLVRRHHGDRLLNYPRIQPGRILRPISPSARQGRAAGGLTPFAEERGSRGETTRIMSRDLARSSQEAGQDRTSAHEVRLSARPQVAPAAAVPAAAPEEARRGGRPGRGR